MTNKKELPKGFTHHRKYEQTGYLQGIFTNEITCPHGVGHEQGIHGCDGCCTQLRGYWNLPEKKA